MAAGVALVFCACTALAGLDGDYAVGDVGGGSTNAGGDTTSQTTAGGTTSTTSGGGQGGGARGGGGGASGGGGAAGSGGAGGAKVDPCTEAGIVACYQFEGDGQDSSAASNHATITNGAYTAGVEGQALDHDVGTLVVAPANALAFSPISIELWMRPTVTQGLGRLTIVDHSGQYGAFILDDGRLQCRAGSLVTASTVTPNVWTHVACVFTDSEIRIYIDGDLDIAASNTSVGTTPTTLYIATDVPSGGEFRGQLDVFRFFDRVRTPQEICASAGKIVCQ